MCGLIGELAWVPQAAPLSLQAIQHRGPDSHGQWLSADGRCWLGHTRLAIQDLSEAGHQPITSSCGRITLVFNGEIYNHLQIRSELPQVNWRGHSDSETLVEALAGHGLAVLPRLLGMYAFAAYDAQTSQLWLARDPLGIKPLYLALSDGGIRFASERRALIEAGSTLELQEVSEVLAWGHLETPLSLPNLQKGVIYTLPPGGQLSLGASSEFHLSRLPVHSQSEPSSSLNLRELLEEVVADHLLADVPVACFLSSGLDSGVLAALSSRLISQKVNTFTVAFPGTPIDEGGLAEAMAAHCGTRHTTLVLTEEQTCQWVKDALQSMDSPTADGLNTYIISRAVAEQGIKVALSGLGADELFGGYPSHRFVPWLQALRHLPSSRLVHLIPRIGVKLQDVTSWDPWQLSLALRRWRSDRDLQKAGSLPLSWPEPPQGNLGSSWSVISLAELHGYTEPMLLRDSDVMSMACGLELRVPFLDQRLVNFALTLPDGAQRVGKALLRDACKDLFPAGYLERPKQGFTLPMAVWMKGPLRSLCLDRLTALCRSAWLNPDWVLEQWQSFEAGRLNWPRAWSLVVLGEFASREMVG